MILLETRRISQKLKIDVNHEIVFQARGRGGSTYHKQINVNVKIPSDVIVSNS